VVEFDRKIVKFSIKLAYFIDERANLLRKSERSAPRESPLYEAAHNNGRAAGEEEDEEIESQLCIFCAHAPAVQRVFTTFAPRFKTDLRSGLCHSII